MIPELDKKILAYALSEKRLLMDISTNVPTEYVHSDMQLFYKILLRCFDKYKEIPTPKVMEEVSGATWSDDFAKLYAEVASMTIDSKEFPLDIENLKLRYNGQVLLKVGKEIFQENWNGKEFQSLSQANVAIKKLSTSIDGIYRNKIFKEGSLSATASDSWTRYKFAKEHPEAIRGITVGLREFDRITNGIQKSELVLIGGESSAGKSALAMNMAINAWLGSNKDKYEEEDLANDGANVLYFSIEMPFESLRHRCDACIAGVSFPGVRFGTLSIEEEKLFRTSLKFQKRYQKQFHILDVPRGCTMAMIESKYIDICHFYTPDLVIVDYIGLMSPDNEQGSDWLNLGRIAEQMHEFCRTYEARVISPVQLNRPKAASWKQDSDAPPPDQHRVGRSIMLTQNANILLNIETRKDEENRSDMVIRMAKMRDGEKGAFVLHKRLDLMRLYDELPEWNPDDYNKDGYDAED